LFVIKVDDVDITLRVTYIRLPPPAQSGAHEDFQISEEGLRIDIEGKDSYEVLEGQGKTMMK
jgi:hypothetical protein